MLAADPRYSLKSFINYLLLIAHGFNRVRSTAVRNVCTSDDHNQCSGYGYVVNWL